MTVDMALRAALCAELTPVLDELRALRIEVQKLHQAAAPPQLEPLSTILSCTKPAALARLGRDAELRALGLRVGRALMFRRAEVLALLAQRAKGSR